MHIVTELFLNGTLPQPNATQPPGTEGLTTILNWLLWIVFFCALAGFLGSLGFLAFAAWTGREMQHAKGLVIAIIVCIAASAASGILNMFV